MFVSIMSRQKVMNSIYFKTKSDIIVFCSSVYDFIIFIYYVLHTCLILNILDRFRLNSHLQQKIVNLFIYIVYDRLVGGRKRFEENREIDAGAR